MARRKAQPRSEHRKAIALAAQQLFRAKGTDATSMDEIARTAGYSKATLYVYFENKEEIIGVLVLESMNKLYDYLALALDEQKTTMEKYKSVCYGLVRYQEEFPFYFQTALEKINVDFENANYLPEEKETYIVGEKIMEKIQQFLCAGIENGVIRKDINIKPTIFAFWSMLSGLIQTSVNKDSYLAKAIKISRNDYLEYGFDMLYRSISIKE